MIWCLDVSNVKKKIELQNIKLPFYNIVKEIFGNFFSLATQANMVIKIGFKIIL